MYIYIYMYATCIENSHICPQFRSAVGAAAENPGLRFVEHNVHHAHPVQALVTAKNLHRYNQRITIKRILQKKKKKSQKH